MGTGLASCWRKWKSFSSKLKQNDNRTVTMTTRCLFSLLNAVKKLGKFRVRAPRGKKKKIHTVAAKSKSFD